MALATTTSRATYTGSGSTGPFAVPFAFQADDDLQVVVRDADTDVETILTRGADYSVSGARNSTGTITLTEALATGDALVIRRAPSVTQGASFAGQAQFRGSSHEDALDRIIMVAQGLQDQLDRSFRLSPSYDPADHTLELKAETGTVLGWDAEGVLSNHELDSSAVSLPGESRSVGTLSAYLSNNRVFNVYDYEAVGDGVALDTVAFQQAADNADGRPILIPAGTFLLDDTIDCGADTHFAFQRGATVTVVASTPSPLFDVLGDDVSFTGPGTIDIRGMVESANQVAAINDATAHRRFSVSGLRFIGEGVLNFVSGHGTEDFEVHRCHLEDTVTAVGNVKCVGYYDLETTSVAAWVTSHSYAVDALALDGTSIYRCIVAHTSGAASEPGVGGSWQTYWVLFGASGRVRITHNTFIPGRTAFLAQGRAAFTLESLDISHNHIDSSIASAAASGMIKVDYHSRRFRCIANEIDGAGIVQRGIDIEESTTDGIIANNIVYDCEALGIHINFGQQTLPVERVIIAHNAVSGIDDGAGGGVGINLNCSTTTFTDIIVQGNIVTDCGLFGYRENSANLVNCLVTDNIFNDNAGGGAFVRNATKFRGNICTGSASAHSLELGASTQNAVIEGNTFGQNAAGVYFIDNGATPYTIRNNTGYITKKRSQSGVFNVSAAGGTGVRSQTIAHGLSFTPGVKDFGVALIRDAGSATDFEVDAPYVDSCDATNVVVKMNVKVVSGTASQNFRFAVLAQKEDF